MSAVEITAAEQDAWNAALTSDKRGEIKETSAFKFREDITEDLVFEVDLLSMLFSAKSEFQEIGIIETSAFGKTLVLDGHTQSAALDEWVYHECLVQPACTAVGWALGDATHKPKVKGRVLTNGSKQTGKEPWRPLSAAPPSCPSPPAFRRASPRQPPPPSIWPLYHAGVDLAAY